MISLRQLQHVLALADQRHFGRAAEALGLTQSALTQSLRALEDSLGVTLFERSRREVTPTAFGNAVIRSARESVQQADSLMREIDQMKNLRSGRLLVRANAWFGEALVVPGLERMLARYPDLRFAVRTGTSEEGLADILAGHAEIYIGLPQENPDDRFTWHALELPPLVLVCRPGHPLASLAAPSARACVAYQIAVPRLPAWYYGWLGARIGPPFTLEERPIESYFVESEDLGIIRRLVRHSDVVTCMLPDMVADDVARGLLCAIALPELDFPIEAAVGYAARRPLSPAGLVLRDELLREAARTTGDPSP